MTLTKKTNMPPDKPSKAVVDHLFHDLSQLIEQSRDHVAREFNQTLVLLNWSIGKQIYREVLANERAEYGEQVILSLAGQLTKAFGKGYSRPSLFRMIRFAKLFPDKKIVSTLSRQLSWSHIILLGQFKENNQRNFYLQMTCIESWSVRTLKQKIDGMLYERTSISKKLETLITHELKKLEESKMITPDLIFRDPCFLNFAGLKDAYSEADLENAILDNISEFIQELGSDFCFVARQKRMSTSKKDRYLDLLFFHRRMSRLIAIELKLKAFEPEHKGQMEWYLRWLDKHERREGEGKPLGIILCANKDQEDVEYLELDQAGIHVAQYLTELPAKQILEEKLHRAIKTARELYHRRLLSNDSTHNK